MNYDNFKFNFRSHGIDSDIEIPSTSVNDMLIYNIYGNIKNRKYVFSHFDYLNFIRNYENKGFPTKKDEEWKYTSLKSILKEDYTVFPKNETVVELKDVKKYFIHEIDSYKLVFIDGVYSSFLSDTTHEGMDIC